AFSMAIIVAGCSEKDPIEPVNTGETKSVYLRINTEEQGSPRDDQPTQTGQKAPLVSAIIYFLNSDTDPLIYDVRTVGATGNITMNDLSGGYEFEGVPSSVTQVYIVGNYNSSDQDGASAGFPTIIGERFSDVEDVILNIQQIAYGALSDGTQTGGLLTVMTGGEGLRLYGDNPANWTGTAPLTAEDLYANVTIAPINSRIEIVQFTYTGELQSFTLEGIYINNYYSDLPLSLDPTGYTVTNNGSDVTLYDRTDADNYTYSYYTTLQDYVNSAQTAITGTRVIAPADGTWAYHVFGDSNPVPHIIVKFTDAVTSAGATIATPLYLTVRGFRNGNGAEIVSFEPNTIYKITDLAFTDSDLGIRPEEETINIWVNVEIETWQTVEVTPIL
ncbi:MAG: hypothetical protein LUD15_07115, partial [Bacteroides sp.]|nr:hypothetical protein [Bacteroides sp.]